MIRKYYDGQATNGGGEPLFDASRINAQIKSIQDVENESFNAGIDAAIAICDEARDLEATSKHEELFLDAIIQRLTQLKKQAK